MTKTTGDAELDRAIDRLFAVDEGRPCPVGTALLREFAAARPVDFGFLEPQDPPSLKVQKLGMRLAILFEGSIRFKRISEYAERCLSTSA